MFLSGNILNEGKITANNNKGIKSGFSEGKSPKSVITETRLPGSKSTRTQSYANSNWQKLRG